MKEYVDEYPIARSYSTRLFRVSSGTGPDPATLRHIGSLLANLGEYELAGRNALESPPANPNHMNVENVARASRSRWRAQDFGSQTGKHRIFGRNPLIPA